MSLIKCPECEKEISDKATSCPRCGYPLDGNNFVLNEMKSQSEQNAIKTSGRNFKVFLTLTVVCVVCWIAIFLWQECNASEITSARASGFASSVWGSYQSAYEKKIVNMANNADIIKKAVILLGIFLGSLSVHSYRNMKKYERKIE